MNSDSGFIHILLATITDVLPIAGILFGFQIVVIGVVSFTDMVLHGLCKSM